MTLHECVSQAVQTGHITSAPLATRLHTALDQGSNRAAINWLTRFQSLAENAAGNGIDLEHADPLTHHAATVIHTLQRFGNIRQVFPIHNGRIAARTKPRFSWATAVARQRWRAQIRYG